MTPLSCAITSTRFAPAFSNRGLDADADLEQLATLETRRRRLIPEIEGLKREQNAAGDEVARAKRQGQDATPLFAASKARGAADPPARDPARSNRAPAYGAAADAAEPAPRERSRRPYCAGQHGGPPARRTAGVRFRTQASRGPRPRPRHPRHRAGHAHERLALRGADGGGGAHGASPHQLHARRAHAGARLHRGGAAISRQHGGAARNGQPPEVRTGPLQDRWRLGPLPDSDR